MPSELIEAAIKFDERKLCDSEDAGAEHFVGVMRLDPRHLEHESAAARRLPIEIRKDGSSLLFDVGEVLRVAAEGRVDDALAMLASRKVSTDMERLLVLLVRAWMRPSGGFLLDVHTHLEASREFPQDVVARSYVKLMTWTLESFGVSEAQPYYDLALRLAPSELQKAIYQVGEAFGRESRLVFPPADDDLVVYPLIEDRAKRASADLTITKARKRLAPFARSFGADTRTLPVQFRAAEMQADWTGALWLLKNIWRLKGAILLQEGVKDAEETADGIAAWVLSDGGNFFRLLDENEQNLSAEILNRLLVKEFRMGHRISTRGWIEICSAVWDELPAVVSDTLIDDCPIDRSVSTEDSTFSDDAATRLFANLNRVDTPRWLERYRSLSEGERVVVATALSANSAEILPTSEKIEISAYLLDLSEDNEGGPLLTERTFRALATLLRGTNQDNLIERFLRVIPREFAAGIGIAFPMFLRRDLVEQQIEHFKSTIAQQLAMNQSGQWSGFARDLPMSAAQAMVALKVADMRLVDLLAEFANAKFTAANDVISSIRALSWLIDVDLVSEKYVSDRRFSYRSSLSPVDKYWTGRDDLRAVNAAIAGLYARLRDEDAVRRLIVAARDPDMEVRMLAIGEFAAMASRVRNSGPAIDAMILGAVYDPESRVQEGAVRLVDQVSDFSVYELAWGRLASLWDRSHRRVRVAAARAAKAELQGGRALDTHTEVMALARRDRSLLVREVVPDSQ